MLNIIFILLTVIYGNQVLRMENDNDHSSVTSGRSSSLSDLSAAQDADPYIDPSFAQFVDMFDDDDMHDLVALGEEILEEAEYDELGDIGGTDFLDIVQAFAPDVHEGENDFPDIVEIIDKPYCIIPAGRKQKRELITHDPLKGPYALQTVRGEVEVYLRGDGDRKLVGISKRDLYIDSLIESEDYYKLANEYAEEVGGKGVNLGFSNFAHSTTILMLARNLPGVIEPHDGYDYASEGITFEVTGQNYQTRDTDADIVLNKYLMNSCMLSDKPYHYNYQTWSWNEDSGVITSFYDTAFDHDTTTRSRTMRKIATILPELTKAQRDALGVNYTAYSHKQGIPKSTIYEPKRDFENTLVAVWACIKEGCKERDGKFYAPSPFRVQYPQSEETFLDTGEVARRTSLQMRSTDYGQSTYHTWPMENDPRAVLMSKNGTYPEKEAYAYKSLHDALYENLKNYKIFTSIVIQAALLPKINGKGGCYYDKYNRVGIAWYRTNSSALTWSCIFYTFTYPGHEQEIGKWSFNERRGVYVSPTFMTSRQDIHYSSILPAMVASALSAIRPLLDPQEYARTEPKIMMAVGIQANSTWATSHRTGANRFLTCCHVSSSGDLPSLISGQLKWLNKHRFCDYFQLYLFTRFIIEKPATNCTPLLRLPFAVMAYEKDFSQTLQWHMRTTNHSTNCMIKVTDAAKRHKASDAELLSWFDRQHDFLMKMMDYGCVGDDYHELMESAPEFPAFNIIAFMGMCNIIKSDIKDIGSIQHAIGFNIWSMMTDRHCTEYMGKKGGVHHIKTSKVVETMSKYLHSIAGATGGYELIAKMASGAKLPPNLLLNHYKDGKESEREISQMFAQHRIKQNHSEVLCETFTGNHADDMMSDSDKYNRHVEDTMDPAGRGRSMHASEDRARFCQEQDPQSQGIAIASIAAEAGSTCLRSSAAMALQNKTREVVYPHDADHTALIGDHPSTHVMVESRSEKHFTRSVKIERNMTQGLGGISGGAVNTVFVTASARVFESMVPGFKNTATNITSDDVKRSGVNDSKYSHESVFKLYKSVPNRNIKHAMMVENLKKPIFSLILSEFNNVVATTTGMVSQSPVFATLTIQPLLSKSLFGDISTVVNTTRSTLSWGCPPDVMQCGLFAMLRVLRQKWLLNDDDMDVIWMSGLLPRNISEHIEGFWIRNEDTMKRLYHQLDVDQRTMLLEGKVTIYDSLKRLELDMGRKKKKKKMKIEPIPGLRRANEVMETILSQRLVAEKLLSRHVQPLHPKVRYNAKTRFMQMLCAQHDDPDISDVEALRPARIITHVRAARMMDRKPCSLGTSASIPSDSLQRIRASRFLSVNYRDHLTENELRIVQLDEAEYNKAMTILERSSRHQGFSFKSPAGKPFTRLFDNRIMKRPAVFNFSVNMNQPDSYDKPFTHKGRRVNDFKPCMYGSNSLQRLRCLGKKSRHVLAFGTGKIDNVLFAFYKRSSRGSKIQCVSIEPGSRTLSSITVAGDKVYYLSVLDASPLLTIDHKSNTIPQLPGVVGDNDAIMNYGCFCRSNVASGFKVYRDTFKNFKSVMPTFVMSHMPNYPFFPLKTTNIEQGNITSLRGYRAINRLKLILPEHPPQIVEIDLSNSIPIEMRSDVEEDIVDW